MTTTLWGALHLVPSITLLTPVRKRLKLSTFNVLGTEVQRSRGSSKTWHFHSTNLKGMEVKGDNKIAECQERF